MGKPPTSLLHDLFSKKKFRLVQKLTGVHRIHHVQWSHGWKLPFSTWAYFERHTYADAGVMAPVNRTKPAHWERVKGFDYHDCTVSGVY